MDAISYSEQLEEKRRILNILVLRLLRFPFFKYQAIGEHLGL